MEHELSGYERGWWVVSQEAKLWLPQGELPFGSAADAGLTGMLALPIGEWAGDPVWLVRQTMPRDMGSGRQMLDAEPVPTGRAGRAACGVLPFASSLRLLRPPDALEQNGMGLPVRPLPRTL